MEELLAEAAGLGFCIRREWLGGEIGGACEIAGRKWIFIDQSLSVDEQIEQLQSALSESIATQGMRSC